MTGLLVVYDALAECPGCGVTTRLVTDGARAYAAGTADAGAIERDRAALIVTCGELVNTCGPRCPIESHRQTCGGQLVFMLGDDGRQADPPAWGGWTAASTSPAAVELLARYGQIVEHVEAAG